MDRDLGEALGQVFVEKTFSAGDEERALAHDEGNRGGHGSEICKQLPWMSDATKQQALEKLHAMVNKIGYPDKWRDYSSIQIDRGDFLGQREARDQFSNRSASLQRSASRWIAANGR